MGSGGFSGFLSSGGGIGNLLSGGAQDNFSSFMDPMGIFSGPESLGSPPAGPDPEEVSRDQAITSALRADIIKKNTRMRSSTAGAGSRFLTQQRDGIQDSGPTTITPAADLLNKKRTS